MTEDAFSRFRRLRGRRHPGNNDEYWEEGDIRTQPLPEEQETATDTATCYHCGDGLATPLPDGFVCQRCGTLTTYDERNTGHVEP